MRGTLRPGCQMRPQVKNCVSVCKALLPSLFRLIVARWHELFFHLVGISDSSRVRKSESPSGVGIRLPSQWAQALVTRVPHSVSFEYGRCQRESALMWIHDKGEHATLQVIRWCGSRDLRFLSITGVISWLGECHTICHRCSCTWHECAAFDT